MTKCLQSTVDVSAPPVEVKSVLALILKVFGRTLNFGLPGFALVLLAMGRRPDRERYLHVIYSKVKVQMPCTENIDAKTSGFLPKSGG